ncbi:MAG: hypothetical protein ACI9CE_001959 [Flavobacterium sp.]
MWIYLPSLAQWQLRSALASQEIELDAFEMRRPQLWFLRVESLDVVSPLFMLHLVGMQFDVTRNLSVDIKEVKLTLSSTASSTSRSAPRSPPSETPPLRREEIIQTFFAAYAQLPDQGHIERFTFCEIACSTFSLDWYRGHKSDTFRLQISHQDFLLTGSLAPRNLELDIVGRREYLAYASSKINLTKAGKIDLALKANLGSEQYPLGSEGFQGYTAQTNHLSLNANGSLPAHGTTALESIIADAEFKLNIMTNSEWHISGENITLSKNGGGGSEIELVLSNSELSVALKSQLNVVVDVEGLDPIDVHIEPGDLCVYRSEDLACQIDLVNFRSEIAEHEVKAAMRSVDFHLLGDELDISSELDLQVFGRDKPLSPLLEYSSHHLFFDGKNLSIPKGEADMLGMGPVITSLQHSVDDGRGSLITSLQIPAARIQVSKLLKLGQVSADIKLSSGQIFLASDLAWIENEINRFSIELAVTDLGLIYQGYKLEGGQMDLALSGWPELRSSKPILVKADRLNIGTAILNPEVSFDAVASLAETRLKVEGHTLAGKMLGGSVLSHDFDLSYTDAVLNGQIALMIDRFDLNKLLALEGKEFESSGYLSGSVPIQIRHGRLAFEGGAMAALSPGGIIQYQPRDGVAESLKKNQSLALVASAMSNFHYESLNIGLKYTPEGILFAKTSLKGSNPDYENGREIHFNLNLEENVSTLMKSLRLTQELADNLDKKVKERVGNEVK